MCCFVGSLGIGVACLLCAVNSFFSTMINFAAAAMSNAMHFIHVIYQFNLYVILIPILMENILVAYGTVQNQLCASLQNRHSFKCLASSSHVNFRFSFAAPTQQRHSHNQYRCMKCKWNAFRLRFFSQFSAI